MSEPDAGSDIASIRTRAEKTDGGWLLNDLWYYIVEYDLRERAHEIDTARVGVHILSGEYDYSGTVELGRAAHEAIAGSTWSDMPGVGHFPMSENPDAFIPHLLPILDLIRAGAP